MFDYDPKHNEDGSEKHIDQDGARYHVKYYDSIGVHCSEPNCEINKRKAKDGSDG